MSASSLNPSLERYIEILVEASKGRPVLQFNRVDFRLPYLRARFPRAKVLHIYRHPRDQWCSSLIDIHRFPKDLKLRDFGPFDGFYLLTWGRDLHRHFPFLTLDAESHPYELFYQIWKLSYLFGKMHADLSISLEQILDKPQDSIRDIMTAMSMDCPDERKLHLLVEPVQTGKWARYADHNWFCDIETRVENVMKGFFQDGS